MSRHRGASTATPNPARMARLALRVFDPVRPLPVVPRPYVHETFFSYLWRLARANHITMPELGDLLRDPLTDDPAAPVVTERLAAAVGRPVEAVHQALPETRPGQPRAGDHVPTPYGFEARPRRPCRQCVADTDSRWITQWVQPHTTICRRHERWLGTGARDEHNQFDLGTVPDVVDANRQHRRLLRRHGLPTADRAYQAAVQIVYGWARYGDWQQHVGRRLDVLVTDNARICMTDPRIHAALYPDVVQLTSLIASPYWRAVMLHRHRRVRVRIFPEIGRRIGHPNFRAYSALDPLEE